MSGCDLSQVARIYAVVSNVSKSRSVAKCLAAVSAKSHLAKEILDFSAFEKKLDK